MAKYNLDKLIKVRVCDFTPSVWYEYKTYKPRTFFRWAERKAGIYSALGGNFKGDKIDGHTVMGGELYENPEVVLSFQNDFTYRRSFKTLKDAEKFAKEITTSKGWVIL